MFGEDGAQALQHLEDRLMELGFARIPARYLVVDRADVIV
jgi:hypothetical protein